jgi:cobalamin synthase
VAPRRRAPSCLACALHGGMATFGAANVAGAAPSSPTLGSPWPFSPHGRASFIAVATALLAGGLLMGAIALAVACIGTLRGGWAALRVLGGVSGDTFGAVNKLVEIAAYLALAAAWAV